MQALFSEVLEEEGGNYVVQTVHIVEEKETRIGLVGLNRYV